MRSSIRPILLTIVVFATTATLPAQTAPLPEILVIGTYHMANRNHDAYNVHADDVLSPRRQREIAQVIEVLKRFRPTKIAIEADIDDQPRVEHDYAAYVTGGYTLSRDETNQLGFRLAHELGQAHVYAVNAWAGNDFPLQPVSDFAKAHDRSAQFQTIMAKWGAATKELDDYLASHTILETLKLANSETLIAENMGPYFELARLGEPGDYAGPDLIGNYYLRNIRIYRNIVSLISSPNDRIVVVYGYGHLGWLQQIIREDPTVRLRTLSQIDP